MLDDYYSLPFLDLSERGGVVNTEGGEKWWPVVKSRPFYNRRDGHFYLSIKFSDDYIVKFYANKFHILTISSDKRHKRALVLQF